MSVWRWEPLKKSAVLAGVVAALGLGVTIVLAENAPQGAGQAQGRGQGQGQGQQGGAQGQGQQGRGQGGGGGRGQGRDVAQTPAVGTGAITGTVTTMGSGSPVRRARVSLNGAELRGGRTVLTNDQGVFSFAALPPGRFTMSASKAGYVDIPYGASKPGRPGTAIQLAEGMKLDKININLPKGSVVTGFVIDENGEPSPGTQVRVLRYVIRTGEKALQQAGQATTDDRGQYRVWGLQPGDYMVSAVPRNQNIGGLAESMMAEVQAAVQQAQQAQQAAGGRGAGGGGGGGGRGGQGVDAMLGGRGANLLDRASQLQQQFGQAPVQEPTSYAPVYFPGTTQPGSASTVTIGLGEERPGVDFQLQLVQTAKVEGTVATTDGTTPQGIQISLVPVNQGNVPTVPGVGVNSSRVGPNNSKFSFTGVAPGQYTVMARAAIRAPTPEGEVAAGGRGGRGGPGGQGPGGRGGPGQITQVLWGATDVNVAGQDMTNIVVNLQAGMTIQGRISFESSAAAAPTDLTRVRVNLQPRGQQQLDMGGGIPPATVDATGNFTITGVTPGKYTIQANVGGAGGGGGFGGAGAAPGGAAGGVAGGAAGGRAGGGAAAPAATPAAQQAQWTLKTAIIGAQDVLDFPLEIQPNAAPGMALLTFTDRSQDLSGALQDAAGRPAPDYTIIVFPVDSRFWTPQARRIQSARPDTAGKFSFRGLPPGEYRLAAVTDVETGEWYDPAFLQQLVGTGIPISLAAGEKKVQDLRVTGGGH